MGLHVGLDVGIASVGWCVIDSAAKRIVGLGVRTFPAAENPKNGAPLAEPRRLARSARRRLKRRRRRLEALREFLVAAGTLSRDDLADAFVTRHGDASPFELRVAGLDRRLDGREWARVLMQMCKRRGYKSMRLSEKESDDEGAVKKAIAENLERMAAGQFRTVGEMILRDPRFAESKRNRGDYKGAISRNLLLDEIATLFEAQRAFGNSAASQDLEDQFVAILSTQAPISEGEALMSKVGRCAIDRTNPRVPAATLTFERFRIVDKLLNFRYTPEAGASRCGLTDEERADLASWAFERVTPLTHDDVRKRLHLSAEARFVGLPYGRGDEQVSTVEKRAKLPHPKSWHRLRTELETTAPCDWERICGDIDLYDEVAQVLTYFKIESSVRRELDALGLSPDAVDALSDVRFSGHGRLSRETLRAILPHMEGGTQYSDACADAGFSHSHQDGRERCDRLPAIPLDDVRNPVVLRALSQSRKVLNAIIDEFGPIEQLHIELARDVAKSHEDRRAIERKQHENRAANERLREDIRAQGGLAEPRPLTMLKYGLWREQGGRCPYSGTYIDLGRLMSEEPGFAEVDHILPHGRSFDDGRMNKVLVNALENQRKRGKTPFEYLGGDSARWHEFEERVRSMHLPRPKTDRLLRTNFDEKASEEFRERNLTDTRYMTSFLKTFVEENLRFAGDLKRPVLAVNGGATAYLRTGWRLQKVRSEGDLHHALDAAVVAVTDAAMVQAVSRFYSVKPLRNHAGTFFDPATGEVVEARYVPEPWEGFAHQLEVALNNVLRDDPIAAPAAPDGLRPILVSRMPRHGVSGAAHAETIRRIEGRAQDGRTLTSKRVQLEDLTPEKLERMVGRNQDRELYTHLADRLADHRGDGRKAFVDPIYKPSRPGHPAPRVRSIRVMESPSSGGALVRGGLADNASMVRTDVFTKDGRFYLVPVYAKDVASGTVPNKAIVSGKCESDWRDMDDGYSFVFSLFMDDLVRLVKRKGTGATTLFGYFAGTDRNTGSIRIVATDSSWTRKGIGVATGVLAFEKYQVDVLGREVHRVKRERRLGFSNGNHQQPS